MRLIVLVLSLLFAQAVFADGSASATIFLSVSLEAPEFEVSTSTGHDFCTSDSMCQQTRMADYSIEEANGELRVSVDPVVHVTITPI